MRTKTCVTAKPATQYLSIRSQRLICDFLIDQNFYKSVNICYLCIGPSKSYPSPLGLEIRDASSPGQASALPDWWSFSQLDNPPGDRTSGLPCHTSIADSWTEKMGHGACYIGLASTRQDMCLTEKCWDIILLTWLQYFLGKLPLSHEYNYFQIKTPDERLHILVQLTAHVSLSGLPVLTSLYKLTPMHKMANRQNCEFCVF